MHYISYKIGLFLAFFSFLKSVQREFFKAHMNSLFSEGWTAPTKTIVLFYKSRTLDQMQTPLAICCGRFDAVDYSWTLSEAASGFGIKSKRLCF